MSEPELHSEVNVVTHHDLDTVDLPRERPVLSVRSFGLTHPGQVRESNEDQFLVATLIKALQIQQTSLPQPATRRSTDCSHLFIVADGMGGAAAGEEASKLAVDSVETYVLEALEWFASSRGQDEDKVLAEFRSALHLAHERVRSEAADKPGLRGMGTTLTLAYSLNDELFVAHVGDSRCYLFRASILYRLTQDHTLVEEMVKRGVLKADEAAHHRWRHVITSSVGGESSKIRIDVHRLYLEANDVVLLCSDGLTEMVKEDDIANALAANADPELTCFQLIALANEAGGRDNITAVIARFELAN